MVTGKIILGKIGSLEINTPNEEVICSSRTKGRKGEINLNTNGRKQSDRTRLNLPKGLSAREISETSSRIRRTLRMIIGESQFEVKNRRLKRIDEQVHSCE